MYFWNVDQLVKDLKTNVISEYEKMTYLIGFFIMHFFGTLQPRNSGALMPLELAVINFFVILHIAIMLWGVVYCYRLNAQRDNKNFIERFIILGFPLSIRFMVLSFALFFAGLFLMLILLGLGLSLAKVGGSFDQQLFRYSESKRQLLQFILICFMQVLIVILSFFYYKILGRKIAAVAEIP